MRMIVAAIILLQAGVLFGQAVDEHTLAYWSLNEGSGDTVYDQSGNGNNGTIDGAEWTAGMIGNALYFDGQTNLVAVPDSDSLHSTTGDITIEGWLNVASDPTGWPHAGPIVFKDDAYLFVVQHGNGVLWFGLWGAALRTSGTYTFIEHLNEWHHAAVTFEGDSQMATIYVDGEFNVEGIVNEYVDRSTNELHFAYKIDTDSYFHGMLDEVRISDVVRTQEEIQEFMLSGTSFAQAYGPAPKTDTVIDVTSTSLEWLSGNFAAAHKVYFGESFDAVDDGSVEAVTTTEITLDTDAIPGYADGLTPGRTYYWRVDEVNDLHPDSPWRGEVWSFQVRPLTAWSPTPADGSPYTLPDQQLSWEAGIGVLFHLVYFGESFDEVNDATSSTINTNYLTCDPGTLEPGKTYYWRVDEFSAGMVTHKGPVWSFTTAPDVAVTDPDLVGWWTLDEGAGTTAVDWSGYGHHGTLVADPEWTDGYHGGALRFDVGKYVDCGYDAADEVTGDFTLAAWAKMDPGTAGHYAGIAGKLTRGPSDEYWGYSLVRHSSNVFRLWVGDGDSAGINGIASSDVQYTDTEWHHVAGMREGQTNILYVDGVRQAETNATDMIVSPDWFHIGRQYAHLNDRYMRGVVDDVRIYNRILTDAELAEAMRGNTLVAASPSPTSGATVDIRSATMLSWTAGETAVSHNVYFGTDRDALELQGNQPGTSLSLAGLVEFGGGDYFWRVDEVEADGTVQTGYVWRFTVPAYLIVDDFESYDNNVGSRVFETWIDGYGYTQPEPGHLGNGTGSAVGHDIWTGPQTYLMETSNAYAGQAMPVYYDNTVAPGRSEADCTFTPGQNWTAEGVTTLLVHFRGDPDNAGQLYVEINGTRVPYNGDPADITSITWVRWPIDLASVSVSLTNITTLTIGIEGGETGVLYVDEIRLVRP